MTIDCNKINLKNGSTGDQVKEVQKYLKYIGYYTSEIDGAYGTKTVSAVKNFQKNKGLFADGIFGPITCKASCINGCDISGNTTRKIYLNTWTDIMTRYNNYTKNNGKEPNICYIDKNNPYEYITNKKYKEMLNRYETYIKEHNNTKPNYVAINKTSVTTTNTATTTTTTTPTNTNYTIFTVSHLCERSGGDCLGQSNSVRCGPHSIKQCLRRFGITGYSEATIAGYAGTTSNGTDHQGLNTAIAKIAQKEGINLKVEWKNFSDLGNTTKERFKKYGDLMTDPDKALFCHVLYRNRYGHYETLKRVNTNNSGLTVANSLGSKCTSTAYCGYMESRSFSTHQSYLSGISQKSICIITKV